MGLHLNNRLKVGRAEHNLSQDELARLVGVTRLDCGLTNPLLGKLIVLVFVATFSS